jgi:hypothetical protein
LLEQTSAAGLASQLESAAAIADLHAELASSAEQQVLQLQQVKAKNQLSSCITKAIVQSIHMSAKRCQDKLVLQFGFSCWMHFFGELTRQGSRKVSTINSQSAPPSPELLGVAPQLGVKAHELTAAEMATKYVFDSKDSESDASSADGEVWETAIGDDDGEKCLITGFHDNSSPSSAILSSVDSAVFALSEMKTNLIDLLSSNIYIGMLSDEKVTLCDRLVMYFDAADAVGAESWALCSHIKEEDQELQKKQQAAAEEKSAASATAGAEKPKQGGAGRRSSWTLGFSRKSVSDGNAPEEPPTPALGSHDGAARLPSSAPVAEAAQHRLMTKVAAKHAPWRLQV